MPGKAAPGGVVGVDAQQAEGQAGLQGCGHAERSLPGGQCGDGGSPSRVTWCRAQVHLAVSARRTSSAQLPAVLHIAVVLLCSAADQR